MKPSGPKSIHGSVTVDMDDSRMLQVSRLCASLPVFASEALRTCAAFDFTPVIGCTGQLQSHSPCLNFSLPASDMPHTALLVGLIFPHTASPSPSPTGCLALSSCGETLRLWPRLARNSVHTDVNLSASFGGLYGDEAIQLEPTSVPGTFVVATRTGHLLLVDPRNARDGVVCRLLTGTSKSDRPPPTGYSGGSSGSGLLSGIGRRVSNLFNLVASSGGLTSLLTPARGGGNMVFVRLVTRPNATPTGLCRIYMLLENQLDVWTIDRFLEEQMQDVFSIESLLRTSTHEPLLGQWRAVDMAIRQPASDLVCPSDEQQLIYILVSNAIHGPDDFGMYHLVTLNLSNRQPSTNAPQLCQSISSSAVLVEWPFGPPEPNSLQLCLPAMESSSVKGCAPLYPCLLACVYSVRAGQVVVVEVLTGQLVATLEFGRQNSAPVPGTTSTGGRLPYASALIGCGSVDTQNLFVYVTCQRGLLALSPLSETGFTVSAYSHMADLNHSSIGDSDKSIVKTRPGNISLDSMTGESNRQHADRVPVIVVNTGDGRSLQTTAQLTVHGLTIWDPNDPGRVPLNLHPKDRGFVGVSEAARVYWMGFQEQASKYLSTLLAEADVQRWISSDFVRLVRRILDERPLFDARWRSVMTSAHADEDIPISEGCLGFQFVVSRPTAEAPILAARRLVAKLEAVQRLKELLSLVSRSDKWVDSNALIPICEVNHYLGIRLPIDTDDTSEVEGEKTRRRFAGEETLAAELPCSDEDAIVYSCMLADDDNEVETCAQRLLRSLESSRALQAAEDEPLDISGRYASVHVLSCFHMAEELVEFTRALHTKLARAPQPMIQPIFQDVALSVGFSPSALQTVQSQEAVLQTISLIPNFIMMLAEAVNRGLSSSLQSLGTMSPSPIPSVVGLVSPSTIQLLLESVDLISAGLAAVSAYRDRQLATLYKATDIPGSPKTHYLVGWLTDARPFGVGDVLLNFFENLVRLGCGELAPDSTTADDPGLAVVDTSQLTKDATARAIDWAGYLLGVAQQRLRWATNHSCWVWSSQAASDAATEADSSKQRLEIVQRLRRMRHWFVQLRKLVIDAIADRLHRPDAALNLAERFADCAQMVRLCYLLELQDGDMGQDESTSGPLCQRHYHQKLAELLRRVPADYGLADHALRWYFACGEHARVQSLLTLLERTNKQDSLSAEPSRNSTAGDHVFTKPKPPKLTVSGKQQSAHDRGKITLDPVRQFLRREDARDLAWPHLLSTRRYPEAARMLFEEGCKETRFLGRRKTLLSLAKLAAIADATESSSIGDKPNKSMDGMLDPFIEKVDLLLECVELQEQLPKYLRNPSPVSQENSPDSDWRHDCVLDIDQLARLYVSRAAPNTTRSLLPPGSRRKLPADSPEQTSSQCTLMEFRRAFRLADLLVELADVQPKENWVDSLEARNMLLLHIWCQALKMDDWSKILPDEDPVQICSRSFICSLVRNLNRTHNHALELLFTPERLFSCPELEPFASDPQFRYLIQSGFEFMQSISV
ncbi:hypothetical protein P879_00793 [Paragonimus westermani]|uniref:Nuclear pore complex protein Nup133 n=1 Tax=Paragonimus westermani TaxID=34504 RepID=A0A8T0D8Q1_9TREM|nr:hypothetical protein P879_00793 [Paragonimus westermani]